METYAVPRPINYRNGYEDRDEVPRYLNVGRSVETELQYVAMQEEEEKRERDAGSSMAAADGNTHGAVGQGKKSGNVKTSSRRRTGWLWVIVSVQGVTFLLAFIALVLGAMSVGKLRDGGGDVGCGGVGGSSPLQEGPEACRVVTASQPVPVCFTNTTLCNSSTGECSVFYNLPQNATVKKIAYSCSECVCVLMCVDVCTKHI